MTARTQFLARLAYFVVLFAATVAARVHTVTRTVTVTKTKHYATTLTQTSLGGAIFFGDVPEAGYPFPTDVSTTTLTSTATSYLTTTETAQSRTTIPGTSTTTVPPYGFTEGPIQDTLPSAAYYYLDGGLDPVARLKAREADLGRRELLAQARSVSSCRTTTTTKTKTKTIKATATKTITTTFTGTYITWSSESYGIPASEYTSPIYTSTKTVSTTADGAVYLETTVTTTAPGTTTLLSTTTTVFQACATQNFADSIALSDGSHPRIDRIATNTSGFVEKGPIPDTPTAYDCCVKALYGGITRIASAWLFLADDNSCYYFEDDLSGLCLETTSQFSNLTAYYGNGNTATRAVYGNGQCGRVATSQFQLNG